MKNNSKMMPFFSNKKVFTLVGIINILLFHFIIFKLYHFLYHPIQSGVSILNINDWVTNIILLLFFCLPHSLLLRSSTKKYIQMHLPASLYPTIYSMHASISLGLIFVFWKHGQNYLYHPTSSIIIFSKVAYVLSWFYISWAIFATGVFKQSGIDVWYAKIKGRSYQNKFPTTGPFQYTRHPIYIGFLGMIWFTPYYTADRLFLSVMWTIYILIGIYNKENRLQNSKIYQQYCLKVNLFPFVSKKLETYIFSKWHKKGSFYEN